MAMEMEMEMEMEMAAVKHSIVLPPPLLTHYLMTITP